LLVGALALAMVATAVYGIAHRPGTARANATSFDVVCETYSTFPPRCLDLLNNTTSAGVGINLNGYTPGSFPDSEKWNALSLGLVENQTTPPFTDRTLDSYCAEDTMYLIEKKEGSGHNGCASLNDSLGLLVWEPCNATCTKWVRAGAGFLVNVDRTNQSPNGAFKWLMSLSISNPPSCEDEVGNHVAVAPQGSANCNVAWDILPQG
jgi:hypothetical protein